MYPLLIPIIAISAALALSIFIVERRMDRRKRAPRLLLRDWATETLPDEATRHWLASLDAGGVKQLHKRLRSFGKTEGLDINDFLRGRFDDNPDLHGQAAALIGDYLSATRRLATVQAEREAHQWLAGFRASPGKRRYRESSFDLYTRLVRARLTPAPTLGESMRATEEKRRKMAREAIFKVAQEDRSAFNAVLRRALRDWEAGPSAAEPTAEEEAA